jgi:hypothetical protein
VGSTTGHVRRADRSIEGEDGSDRKSSHGEGLPADREMAYIGREKSTDQPQPDPGCTAPEGKHGTRYMHSRWGCSCRAALRDVRLTAKRQRAGILIATYSTWNAVATERRLQAAAVLGYGSRHLAPMLGMTGQRVSNLRVRVHPTVSDRIAERVRVVVERLHRLPPPRDPAGSHSGGHVRARNLATRSGWAPLDAWEPEEIGDPDALSDLAYRRTSTSAPSSGAEYLEKLELGYDELDIARDHGVDVETVKDVVRRERRQPRRGRPPKVTAERLARARARIAQGEQVKDVAADLGISRPYLSNLLAGRGRIPAGLAGSDAGRTTTRPPTAAPHQEGRVA